MSNDIYTIKEIATFILDGDWIESKDQANNGIRLIQTGNIGVGEFVNKEDKSKFIDEDTFLRLNCTEVKENDILVSRLPDPIGRACIVPFCGTKMITAVDCTIIRLKNHICDPKYFIFYTMSNLYNSQVIKFSFGSTRSRISRKNLEALQIPLPPLDIQQKIGQTLDTVSELLALRKKQLAELDNLIQSVFNDMFGDPVTNEKGWDTATLKNITTKIGSGATPRGGKESYLSQGISLIRSMNVHNGRFKYDELAFIDNNQADQLDNVVVQEYDVLLNITGASVARSCIVPSNVLPARVNQHVAILRPNIKELNSHYLNSLLVNNIYQQNLLSIAKAGGATREAITKQQLEELAIILPPLLLQTKFATIVSKIESKKTLVQKSIDETEMLFDSLMSEYFE